MAMRLKLMVDQWKTVPFPRPVRWNYIGTSEGVSQTAFELTVAGNAAATVTGTDAFQAQPNVTVGDGIQSTVIRLTTTLSNGHKVEAHETIYSWDPLKSDAQFISSPDPQPEDSPAPVMFQEFEVTSVPHVAPLAVSALGIAVVYINGKLIDMPDLAPGWSDYNKRVYYEVIDVAKYLKKGKNTIAIMAGDGWYCGHVCWFGRDLYGDRPAIWAALHHGDGVLTTSPDWKVGTGDVTTNDLLMGETIDHRIGMAWTTTAPSANAIAHKSEAEISPLPCPSVHTAFTHKPAHPGKIIDGKTVVDFGVNIAGRVHVTAEGPAGSSIQLRHAEVLNPDGTIYTANLRTAKQTDHFILAGTGTEVFEPRLTNHGFRYVEITEMGGAKVTNLEAIEITTSNTPAITFECDRPLINQLFANTDRSRRGNFITLPTDCPQRDERLGWTGDIAAFSQTALYLCDCGDFLAKWLQDLTDGESATGAVPAVAPDVPARMPAEGGPGWSDALPIVLWHHWLWHADSSVTDRFLPPIVKYIEMRERQAKGTEPIQFEGFGDWLCPGPSTSNPFLHDAYAAHSSAIATTMAKATGHESADHLAEMADYLRQHFTKSHLNEDGTLKENTQTSCALALMFGLADPKGAAPLADLIEKNMLQTGFLGTCHLLPALNVLGRNDLAYKLLLNQKYPGWLFEILNGATSMWERWDGWTPEKGFQDPGMNSFNHYAFGAVGQWMFGTAAGIMPLTDNPGWKRFKLAPAVSKEFGWLECKHDSPMGEILSRWEWHGNDLRWQVKVPIGAEAEVTLPSGFTRCKMNGKERSMESFALPAGTYAFDLS